MDRLGMASLTRPLRRLTVAAMDELDTYRAAKLLLDSKGGGAVPFARERIADLTAEGDVAGRTAWLRIAAAIELLRSPAPDGPVQ